MSMYTIFLYIYRKIFNRNTIKISYSCMSNMKSKISTHNKKILNKPVNRHARKCNCINKNTCPLNRICLPKNILYIARIKSDRITNPELQRKSKISSGKPI